MDKVLAVEREVNPPPESLFLGLGWDENKDSKKRHYRRYYNMELEKVKEILPRESPFDSFDIKKGQSRGGSKQWWPFGAAQKQDDSGEVSDESVVGRFKGLVTV